jgi:hypothetical protein
MRIPPVRLDHDAVFFPWKNPARSPTRRDSCVLAGGMLNQEPEPGVPAPRKARQSHADAPPPPDRREPHAPQQPIEGSFGEAREQQ